MRKYQQLLLLVTCIVCLITLLFYRHEYLKLRSVLSVLNFFGSVSTNTTNCLQFSNDLKQDLSRRYQFSEPRSVWSKLDDHYIYSSFWEDSDEGADGGFIRSIAIGPKSAFYNYKCRIWFEEGDIIVSEEGLVKFDLDQRSSAFTAYKYFLKCFVQNRPTHATPYGVLWSTPTPANVFSPIFPKLKSEPVESALCVLPDYSALPKTNLIEFLSYYSTLGVNDFIIYDSGIQHSIFPFLESVTGRNGLLSSVSVVQWSFPARDNVDLEYLALKDDCLSRTFGKAKFVGITSWNDYVVPSGGRIGKMLSAKKVTDLINLSVTAWSCCLNFADSKSANSAWPLFLRKRSCIQLKDRREKLFANLRSYSKMEKNRIYDIPQETATLYEFKECDDTLQKLTVEVPAPEFASQLAAHKLLALWKSYLNASSIFVH